jgi:hypothetical protein
MVKLDGGTAQKIIESLANAGAPLTRKDIAMQLGRSTGRLNPYDMLVLETLVTEGRVMKVDARPIESQPLRLIPAYRLADPSNTDA